jgi:acetolactate synthase-1/2/3 large subunit
MDQSTGWLQASDTRTDRAGALFGEALRAHGVRQVFTLAGSHINELLAGCDDAGISLIDTRHEATAGHAAEGYAKASGAPGVCVVTAGPGFTNALTPMASCAVDAAPTLFVSGAAPSDGSALNPLQGGFSQMEMARPVAKWVGQARAPGEIPRLVAEAFVALRTGRPGPAYLEIPNEVAFGRAEAQAMAAPVTPSPPPWREEGIAEICARLERAHRPLILAGGGVKYAGAGDALRRLTARTGIPVLTNLNAHGVLTAHDDAWGGSFPIYSHLGVAPRADLLIVLGARFGMLTGGLPGKFGEPALGIVQVDIHAAELDHLRPGDVGIVADCRAFIEALERACVERPGHDFSAWRDEVGGLRHRLIAAWQKEAGAATGIHPFHLARCTVATLPPDTTFVADGGEAKVWLESCLAPLRLGQYVSRAYSGNLGSGQGLAMGALMAAPDKPLCLFIGDGAWGMHLQEIDTFVRHRLPIITVVVNNGCWGSIRHGQMKLWHGRRQLVTELGHCRYDLAARAFDCPAERVEHARDLEPALLRAMKNRGPSLIDVVTDRVPDPGVSPF